MHAPVWWYINLNELIQKVQIKGPALHYKLEELV